MAFVNSNTSTTLTPPPKKTRFPTEVAAKPKRPLLSVVVSDDSLLLWYSYTIQQKELENKSKELVGESMNI
jgi:hypothetical protein